MSSSGKDCGLKVIFVKLKSYNITFWFRIVKTMNLVNIQGLRQTGMDDAKMTPSAWHTMGTVCGREAAMSVPAEGTRINSFKDGCISCICFNATATEEC